MSDKAFFLRSDDPGDPNGRLAVYMADPESPLEGLVDIADEDCTSGSETAQAGETPTSVFSRLCLTTAQAAWLRDVLIGLNLGEARKAD